MLNRHGPIDREGTRIRMMRNEGRLVFKTDGTLDIAPAEGVDLSPEIFNKLVEVYAGGSTPDTNACLYFIKKGEGKRIVSICPQNESCYTVRA